MIGGQILVRFVERGLIALLVAVSLACPVQAQFGFGGLARVGVVGGVSVDADGAVKSASAIERDGQLSELRRAIQVPSDSLDLSLIHISEPTRPY